MPHIKSKKIQQLQAKPRDLNASQTLLIVAPLTDCRYQNLINHRPTPASGTTSTATGPISNHGKQVLNQTQQQQAIPSTSSDYDLSGFSSITPYVVPTRANTSSQQHHKYLSGNGLQHQFVPQRLIPHNHSATGIPGPEYYQQISKLAAMAWSDCTLATEKLRQIYERTSMLSRDLATTIPQPYSSTAAYMMSSRNVPDQSMSNVRLSMNNNAMTDAAATAALFHHHHPHHQGDPFANDSNYWSIPSVLCSCAMCEMAQRTQQLTSSSSSTTRKMTTPAANGSVSSHQPVAKSMHADPLSYVSNHTTSRALKRPRSPDLAPSDPPRKLVKHGLDSTSLVPNNSTGYVDFNRSYQYQNQQSQQQQQQRTKRYDTGNGLSSATSKDMLLLYLKSKSLAACEKRPQSCAYVNDMTPAAPLSVQKQLAAAYPVSEFTNPRELMATPSFESQYLLNSQFSHQHAATLQGGFLNSMTSFIPPKILNALE